MKTIQGQLKINHVLKILMQSSKWYLLNISLKIRESSNGLALHKLALHKSC